MFVGESWRQIYSDYVGGTVLRNEMKMIRRREGFEGRDEMRDQVEKSEGNVFCLEAESAMLIMRKWNDDMYMCELWMRCCSCCCGNELEI